MFLIVLQMEEEESKEKKSSLHYVKSVTGVTASDDLIRHSSKRHVTNIYIYLCSLSEND